jgi:adenylate kinase family enzyme
VYAEQRGRIVSRQHALETNLVFPWLDNKTFNRWFIPDGCDVPISALDVREADKYDFRLAAFGKIVDQFSKFGVPFGRREGKHSQLSLPGIDRPSVYVISGFSCAGKSTLAEWLAKEFGALHIEASDFMYQQFWQRHGVSSKVKIGDFAEKALLQLPSIVSEQAAKMTIEAKVPVVITGFRSSNEVEDLRSRLHGYSINLVFIDANRDLRFDRARLRAREEVTKERFEKRDRQEKRMGLVKIRALSGATVILNESTFGDFYQSFEKAFDIKNSMRVLRNADPLRLGQLERVIIQALASKDKRCFGDEDYCWYTTTEIAALIAGQFGIKKSKDNVSRYFNQSFHPFYELMHENKKFLCRLSNTGVGVALLLGPEPEHGSRKLRHAAGKTYLLFK